jgi:hypothetical protein
MPSLTSSSRSGSPLVWSTSTVHDFCAAASMISAASSEKYGMPSSGTASPMIPERRFRSVRAAGLGR